jgi:hypothetical protein
MRRHFVPLIALAVWAAQPFGATGAAPKFYDDDPIAREPETQDASNVQEWEIDLAADLLLSLFSKPGDPTPNVRAQNINSIDEVPDSSWFTNRIYASTIPVEAFAKGPNTADGPAPGRWTVIRPKTAGVAPGFVVRDEKGEVWFLQFDAKDHPRAATGAVAVANRLFWALGYSQVEQYLTTLRPADLTVSPDAQIRTLSGRVRTMTMKDVGRVLTRSEPNSDGTFRAVAGRAVPGRVVGGFRYHGTRPDDPNDIVPHEHRRELRALKVFAAWTNLVDVKAGNTLDSVITEDGRGIVRHYLQDVGSTFGTGALAPHDWEEGHEYMFEGSPTWKRLVSLGFYIRPWQTVPYPDAPEIGRFEGDRFEPEEWRTRVPIPSIVRARDDDTFWAALRVMAFTDDMIREAVRAGHYADPASEKVLADALIKRRDKIGQVYLTKINPLNRFALGGDGTLTFENAAVRAGVSAAPSGGYKAVWHRFGNSTREATPLGETAAPEERLSPPAGLPSAPGTFLKIAVIAADPAHAAWARPVDVYFKRAAGGWTLVGLERLP